MSLQAPPFLKANDKIAIVATARKISKEEIGEAIKIFETWGLQVELGKTIGLSQNQFAGSDEERAKDLQSMLNRSDIKAIVCARGGYGTIRILDFLDFTAFTEHPKWLVGYSDVCILHSLINNYLGIQSLHATMPINFKNNTDASIQSLKKALFGETYTINFQNHPLNKMGEAEAEVIGGNLSILYSLLGTKSAFNPDNKILFLEDLDEYLYHIDRMMMALKRAGKLSKLKALVVGGMTQMNDNAISFGKNAEEIILEHCQEYEYPICFNAPIGHLDNNLSLYFGRKLSLKIEKEQSYLDWF